MNVFLLALLLAQAPGGGTGAPIEDSAIGSDGIATDDIDLDTGGYSLILDDGATGAGNGSRYYGQDTDLNWYRSGANTETLEGNLHTTLNIEAGGYVYGIGIISGGDFQTDVAADWDLVDNNASTLSFDAAGKAGILEIDTTDGAEGVKMGGTYLQAPEFVRLEGATSASPALKRSTTYVYFRLADDSDYAPIRAEQGWFQNGVILVDATASFSHSGKSKYASSADGVTERTINDATQGLREDLTVDGVATYTDESGNPLIFTFTAPPVFADYTRHHDTPIGAAIVGATAPGVETIGTFRCVVFDANADLAYINVEVPTEWNRTSNMAIDLLIFTDDGDALGNGEVIEFDLVYRSVDEGEAYDNGTAVTILANVTGGGAEVDKGQYKITATVDYDDTDQPLAINDTVGFSIMRDVTTGDTYSGDVHVCRAQLVYQANALATH